MHAIYQIDIHTSCCTSCAQCPAPSGFLAFIFVSEYAARITCANCHRYYWGDRSELAEHSTVRLRDAPHGEVHTHTCDVNLLKLD